MSEPPTSFKTNVNRQKTKRWVEAKSYNYDGDDWGDADDYDEYGVQEQAELQAQKPTGLRQVGQAAGSRSASMTTDPRNDPRYPQAPPQQPPYARAAHERQSSFGRGDDRRAFSGPGQISPPPMRTAYGQAGSQQQSPVDPHPNNRGPLPAPGFRGSAQSGNRLSTDGYRTQSMTSNSSADMQGRRDFSNPAAVPQPLRGPANPPRKSSVGQHEGVPAPGYDGAPQASQQAPPQLSQPEPQRERADSKGLPFIRPADIYKRMQEEKEREKQRQSQDSSRPSMDAVQNDKPRLQDRDPSPAKSGDESEGARRGRTPALASVAERKSEYGAGGLLGAQNTQVPKAARRTSTSPKLPEIEGFGSDFGADFGSSFLASNAAPRQTAAEPKPEQTAEQEPTGEQSGLQHAPSQGFRSAVHQAFDQPAVPETPSSTSGSNMGRSNSESTSVISPIISRGPSDSHPGQLSLDGQATGTHIASIPEEQGADVAQRDSAATAQEKAPQADEPPANFVPGHRRDMSTPSPNNSPARTPAMEVPGPLPQPRQIQLDAAQFDDQAQEKAHTDAAQEDGFAKPESTKDAAVASGASSRAGSPSKGRVRELAERLNSGPNSRRGSQDGSAKDGEGNSRPPSRLIEGIRSSLPSGWNSYTTTSGANAKADSPANQSRAESPAGVAAAATPKAKSPEPEAAPQQNLTMSLEPPQTRPAERQPTSIVPTPLGMGDGHDLSKDAEYFSVPPPIAKDSEVTEEVATPKKPLTHGMSTESSPSDQESDRLRKELVRQLSPEVEQDGPVTPVPHKSATENSAVSYETRQDSSLVPSEYDRYWNGSSYDSAPGTQPAARNEQVSDSPGFTMSPTAAEAPKLPLATGASATPADHDESSQGLQLNDQPPARGKLTRKFSWEESSENLAADEEPPAELPKEHVEEARTPQPVYEDGLHSVSPQPEPEGDGSVTDEPVEQPREQRAPIDTAIPRSDTTTNLVSSLGPAQLSPTTATKSVAFRGIMAMKSPDDRLDHLLLSRGALMNNDHGLASWITLAQDGVKTTQIVPRPANLTSTAPTADTYQASPVTSALQRAPTAGPAGSSPSGSKLTSQQMQSKGKDFLHSAGLFGGKANVAAKGLFAKGKSKLKSAGGDKAFIRGRSASNSELLSSSTLGPSSRRPVESSTTLATDFGTSTGASTPIPPHPAVKPPLRSPGAQKSLPLLPPAPRPDGYSRVNQLAMRQGSEPPVSVSPMSGFAPSSLHHQGRPSISSMNETAVSKLSSRPSSISADTQRDRAVSLRSEVDDEPEPNTPRSPQVNSEECEPEPASQQEGEGNTRETVSDTVQDQAIGGTSEAGSPRPESAAEEEASLAAIALAASLAIREDETEAKPQNERPDSKTDTNGSETEPDTPQSDATDHEALKPQPLNTTAKAPPSVGVDVPSKKSRISTADAKALISAALITEAPKMEALRPSLEAERPKTSDTERPKVETPAETSPGSTKQPGETTPTQASFPPVLPEINTNRSSGLKSHIVQQMMDPGAISPSQRSSVALGEFEAQRTLIQSDPSGSLDFTGQKPPPRQDSSNSLLKVQGSAPKNKNLTLDLDSRPFSFITFDDPSTQDLSLVNPITPLSQKQIRLGNYLGDSDSESESVRGLSLAVEKELEASAPTTPRSNRRSTRPTSQIPPEPDIATHPAFRSESPLAMGDEHASERADSRLGSHRGSSPLPSPNAAASHHARSASALSNVQSRSSLHPLDSPLRPPTVSRQSHDTAASGSTGHRKKRSSLFAAFSSSNVDRQSTHSRDTSGGSDAVVYNATLPIDDAPDFGASAGIESYPNQQQQGYQPNPGAFKQRKWSMGSDGQARGHLRSKSRQLFEKLPAALGVGGGGNSGGADGDGKGGPKKRRFSGIGGLLSKVPVHAPRRRSSSRGGPPVTNTFAHIRSASGQTNPDLSAGEEAQTQFPPRGSSRQAPIGVPGGPAYPGHAMYQSKPGNAAAYHQRDLSQSTQLSTGSFATQATNESGGGGGATRGARSASVSSSQAGSHRGPMYSVFPSTASNGSRSASRNASRNDMQTLQNQPSVLGVDSRAATASPHGSERDLAGTASRPPRSSSSKAPMLDALRWPGGGSAEFNRPSGSAGRDGAHPPPHQYFDQPYRSTAYSAANARGYDGVVPPAGAESPEEIAPAAFQRIRQASVRTANRQASAEPEASRDAEHASGAADSADSGHAHSGSAGSAMHVAMLIDHRGPSPAAPTPPPKEQGGITVAKARDLHGAYSTTAKAAGLGIDESRPPRDDGQWLPPVESQDVLFRFDEPPQPVRQLRQALPPLQTRGPQQHRPSKDWNSAGTSNGSAAATKSPEAMVAPPNIIVKSPESASTAKTNKSPNAVPPAGEDEDEAAKKAETERQALEEARKGLDKETARLSMQPAGQQHMPAELPAHGEHSDGEDIIVMSSTAYPGQEWRPDFAWDGS